MSKKIGLRILGRPFDVDVEDDFAIYLQKQINNDFKVDGNNDVKTLLQAYVRKNHELFLQEEQVEEILKKLDN